MHTSTRARPRRYEHRGASGVENQLGQCSTRTPNPSDTFTFPKYSPGQEHRGVGGVGHELGHVRNDDGGLALDGGLAVAQAADEQGHHDGQRRRLHRLQYRPGWWAISAPQPRHWLLGPWICVHTSRALARKLSAPALSSTHAKPEPRQGCKEPPSPGRAKKDVHARTCTKVVPDSLVMASATSAGLTMHDSMACTHGSMSRLPCRRKQDTMALHAAFLTCAGGEGCAHIGMLMSAGPCHHTHFALGTAWAELPALPQPPLHPPKRLEAH